jgi:hypothetical protein
MQKSTTFTTIFRVKKHYFLYDFACKKVLLSLRYAKIAIYATSCKMSVFFVLDMTIGPRVSTSGPTCRVQKNGHFATCFIQDFF